MGAERISVERAAPCDCEAWDGYVAQHPKGAFFHLIAWGDVVANSYGYEPLRLIARRGERIVGVVALSDVRAPITGRALISTAFTVGGGALVDDDAALASLGEACEALGRERRARYVEWRCADAPVDWIIRTGSHAKFEMPIPAQEEIHLASIPRKRRADLQKAIKAEAQGDLLTRLADDIDGFYALYARSLRDLGTPVYPRKFLNALHRAFGERMELSFVDWRQQPIAGLVSFYFKDRMMPYYVGALDEARKVHAFDLLYWRAMRRAAERGLRIFDFGRSNIGSGAYRYKALWGARAQPLSYAFKPLCITRIPDLSPSNPKFKVASAFWRRAPLGLANALGPMLAKNFP